jgi:putative transposase
MVRYRRNLLPGGTYFFTVTLRDRRSDFLVSQVQFLRQAFRSVRGVRPFEVDAIVILPDHLHCIWTLPPGDANYAHRWRLIKARFTRSLANTGVPARKNSKGEDDVWQRRFWEHTVRDEQDFEAHVNYIHYNPVKHGLVKRVRDWPYSSFHRFVRMGWKSADWAGVDTLADTPMGE